MIHCRCVAIALPLKRMEWMSVKSAKTKIIPFVVIFNIVYNSYTVFLLTEADSGKFGCNPFGGKPELVSPFSPILFEFSLVSLISV